jgi:ABC-type uncharacterized transport system permease subunit
MSEQVQTRSTLGRIWDIAVRYQAVVVPVVALTLAFTIGGVLIALQGVNPLIAYESLFRAALFSGDGLLRTLQKATPLILTGMAVSIALRVGLFNIGAQGQLIFGALASAYFGYSLAGAPTIVILPTAIAAGILAGAMWASIAGFLKAYRGVHEVISTIMLNSIAYGLIEFLISGPLQEPDQVLLRTPAVAENARLGNIGSIPVAFIGAVLLALLVAWMLNRTTTGFQFNTVGKNKFAALYSGMKISRLTVLAMVFSGGLAGLGGAIETLGIVHRYESGFNVGLGFDGITIALLARANPLATIPAALLVAMLRAGSATLQFDTGIKPEVVDLLLAITLLLVSIPVLANILFRDRAQKQDNVTSGWGS